MSNKIKVSDYIADFLVQHNIDTVFTVTGGGAMHLNDSFGHKEGLRCYYNHHEQASAIAAEGYARIKNKPAVVCVTTGPGGTNALTGVLGAWLDSIPMIVISGQVRYDTTARSTGLKLRAMGDQEFDITKAVCHMTKYAEMVIEPNTIRYHLERALELACTGRPGPVWLDIPLNVQGAYINTDELYHEDKKQDETIIDVSVLDNIISRLLQSKRPVLNAGNGIRIADAYEVFRKLVDKLQIPVVTGWDSIDLMEDEHALYAGRAGIMGDRPGNFAVQNSDFLLSIGSRLSIRQVGYNYQTWARAAYTVVVDVDAEELKKPTLHVDVPVCMDAKRFMECLLERLETIVIEKKTAWIAQCQTWRQQYPVVMQKHYDDTNLANVYCFIHTLSMNLPKGQITVVGNGSACVVGSHAYVMKEGQRFVINSGAASMGYDLPAAIGACIANESNPIICVTGDGSIQMNIQELQTIITNELPIKIFIINNQGYHSIRQTQNRFFGKPLVGIGEESHDLSFPSMEKLAYAYGYPYYKCDNNSELEEVIDTFMNIDGYGIFEVFVGTEQEFEPKAASKQLADGTMVSSPLEDLAPFLPEEEVKRNMYIV